MKEGGEEGVKEGGGEGVKNGGGEGVKEGGTHLRTELNLKLLYYIPTSWSHAKFLIFYIVTFLNLALIYGTLP